MKVVVDRDLCQGHAMCVSEAPDIFAYDHKQDETTRVLVDDIDETQRDAVKRAVKFCPNQALSIEE